MILPIKILKDDFFRLLKNRIPTAYSTRYTEDFGEKLIFKETIDALEQLDSFAQEIREDIWNADSLTFKFRHQEDQEQLAEFCDSFNQLRLKKDLFPHPEIFNHLFFKFRLLLRSIPSFSRSHSIRKNRFHIYDTVFYLQ